MCKVHLGEGVENSSRVRHSVILGYPGCYITTSLRQLIPPHAALSLRVLWPNTIQGLWVRWFPARALSGWALGLLIKQLKAMMLQVDSQNRLGTGCRLSSLWSKWGHNNSFQDVVLFCCYILHSLLHNGLVQCLCCCHCQVKYKPSLAQGGFELRTSQAGAQYLNHWATKAAILQLSLRFF